MVEGRGSCDKPLTRRKHMLRKCDNQFVDNASSYINCLGLLDSLHFSSDVGQCTSKAMNPQRLRLLQQLYEARHLNQQNQIVTAQILVDRQKRGRLRPRRYWVKPWLSRRLDYGHYDREWWLNLFRLQGLPFHNTSGSGGCKVQVPVGGCWQQWIHF